MRQPSGWTVAVGATVLVVLLFGAVFVKYPLAPLRINATRADSCVYVLRYVWQCERPDGSKYLRSDRYAPP